MVSTGHFLAMDGGEVRPSAKEVAAVAQQRIASCLITKTFEIRSNVTTPFERPRTGFIFDWRGAQ